MSMRPAGLQREKYEKGRQGKPLKQPRLTEIGAWKGMQTVQFLFLWLYLTAETEQTGELQISQGRCSDM